MEILFYLFWFIIILSIVVFIHEFGHYYVAKKCGVHIETFSIGFGKELFGYTDRSGTRWKFSLVPLGGYVKMLGDTDAASSPSKKSHDSLSLKDQQRAFIFKSVYQRFAIVFAGPAANYLSAILIMTFMFYVSGKAESAPIASTIAENSAAEKAGLIAGDLIKSVDGDEVSTFEDIRNKIILNTGTPIEFVIMRDGKEIQVSITPEIKESKDPFGNEIKVPLIGIASEKITIKPLDLPDAFITSIKECYNISASTLKAIGQMLTGARGTEDLGGPIRIAKYSGQSAELGIYGILWFICLISVNLGLFNLLPIPMLDGGHLAMYLAEMLRGKPVPMQFQEYAFKFGFFLLMGLMIFATANDIMRLF